MEKKKTLKIDLDELYSAMEDSSYEHEYYLDLVTGEILLLTEYMDDEDGKKLRKEIDDGPDCYERIPKAESHEGYEDMQDFITTVKNERLSELLEVAISGKGAFRQFKDSRVQARALEWLDDIDVSLIKE